MVSGISAAIAIGLCAVQNTRVLFGIAKANGILSTTLFWILWISSNDNTWSTWTWDLIDILTRTWTEQFILIWSRLRNNIMVSFSSISSSGLLSSSLYWNITLLQEDKP